MRALNTIQRKERYFNIQLEVQERVLTSYKNTLKAKTKRGIIIDKSFFYSDLINCLGDYEVELILYNLFYEDSMFEIIQYFNKKDFNKFLFSKKRNLHFKTIVLFFLHITRQKVITKNFELGLLVNYLHNYLPQHEETWIQRDFKNEQGIGILYAKKIINKLSSSPINWKQIIFIDALFFKIWDILPYFKKGEIRKKSVILNYFANHYSDSLNLFISKQTKHKKQIFSNKRITESSFLHLQITLKEYNYSKSIKFDRIKKNLTNIILHSSYVVLIDFIISLNKFQLKYTIQSMIVQTSNISICKLEKKFEEKKNLIKGVQDFFTIKTLYKDLIELRHKHSLISQNITQSKNYSKIDLLDLCIQQKIRSSLFLTKNEILQINKKASFNKELESMKNLLFKRFYLFEKI